MRVRVPLIIEESLIKEIDEIAGEKHRRAATIETALREYIARQGRKAKANANANAAPGAAKGAPRSGAAPAAKAVARAKR